MVYGCEVLALVREKIIPSISHATEVAFQSNLSYDLGSAYFRVFPRCDAKYWQGSICF